MSYDNLTRMSRALHGFANLRFASGQASPDNSSCSSGETVDVEVSE
jgi:hypothetical protein